MILTLWKQTGGGEQWLNLCSHVCVSSHRHRENAGSPRGDWSRDGVERGDIEKHKGEDTAGTALIEHTHEITFLVCICIKKSKIWFWSVSTGLFCSKFLSSLFGVYHCFGCLDRDAAWIRTWLTQDPVTPCPSLGECAHAPSVPTVPLNSELSPDAAPCPGSPWNILTVLSFRGVSPRSLPLRRGSFFRFSALGKVQALLSRSA